jgi:hypothetical protein
MTAPYVNGSHFKVRATSTRSSGAILVTSVASAGIPVQFRISPVMVESIFAKAPRRVRGIEQSVSGHARLQAGEFPRVFLSETIPRCITN